MANALYKDRLTMNKNPEQRPVEEINSEQDESFDDSVNGKGENTSYDSYDDNSIDTETGKKADARISEERSKTIFSRLSQRYNIYNTVTSFGIDRLWRKSLVEASGMKKNSYVLDLAAGTGDVSFQACKQIRPAHIEITDFTAEMLDVAKNRAANGANNHVPVSFNIVDAQN
ncbi:MAG: class I SAM-dependent methyltransferase, partial [Eggerthellaceae bacterium]|nr:class I SAM-dependent methyltransferase [Eggerthellaceae bacterium]